MLYANLSQNRLCNILHKTGFWILESLCKQVIVFAHQTLDCKDVGYTGNQSIQLSGLSHSQLRHYEDLTVKIAGERNENSMEIYKVFLKTKQGYETSYDWDLVNQDLYLD